MPLIQVDKRNRISLGSLTRGDEQYIATRFDDGRIVLEPAVIMSRFEAAVLANPSISAALASAQDGTAEFVEFDWQADA